MSLRRSIMKGAAAAAAAVAFCAATFAAGTSPASAQQIAARVNGEIITAMDVVQRQRLMQLEGERGATRKQALDALIEDQIKLQTAQRYRLEIKDEDLNQVIAGMASRMNASPKQFADGLMQAGVSVNALRRKLRADMAWQNIVRGKFQSDLQVREKDVFLAAREKKDGDVAYTYTLRPILLVVRQGAPPNVIEARRREAEALRGRFQNCDEGLRLARGMRDVAVREQIIRSSADLPPRLREVLNTTNVGRLTPPDITPSGVEVFALCERAESRVAVSGAVRDAREKMFSERFEAQGRRYMQQLRRNALIEVR